MVGRIMLPSPKMSLCQPLEPVECVTLHSKMCFAGVTRVQTLRLEFPWIIRGSPI